MKVMISQPMKGKTNEQIREERAELIKELESQGWEVIDTVFDNAPKGANEAICMLGKSIQFLADADAVVFMPGWSNAGGCITEYDIAKRYGKFVKDLEEY